MTIKSCVKIERQMKSNYLLVPEFNVEDCFL